MKKIGILTFHRALNYGAKLQAFALMKTLSEKYDAYILDYRCLSIEKFYFHKNVLKESIKKFLFPIYMKKIKKRKDKFLAFDSKYKLSKIYTENTIRDANMEMDAFVAGSDQIWNPIITGSDFNYFLKFADDEKKFTYAASFGKSSIASWDKSETINLLNKFKIILLREKPTTDFLESINKEIQVFSVLDPVFLIEKDSWVKNLNLATNSLKRKYILVYIVAEQTNLLEKAKNIAKDKNLDIFFVDALRYKDRQITNINDAGPVDFLQLILNAEIVMTTSFHALAFSIIFNVPFLYELSNKKINANSRLKDLAVNLNIEKYEIKDLSLKYEKTYNWEDINKRVEKLRESSKEILFKSLERIL